MLQFKLHRLEFLFYKKGIKHSIFLFCFLLQAIQMISQTTETALKDFMDKVKEGAAVSDYEYLLEYDNLELIKELGHYAKDGHLRIRYAAQRINLSVARNNSNNSIIRSLIIERLIDDCYAFDPAIWKRALKYLNNFIKKEDIDIDIEKQKKINTLLKDKSKLSKELIFLIGNASLHNEKPFLLELVKTQSIQEQDKYWYASLAWTASITLAKLGEGTFTEYCITKIKGESDYNIVSQHLFEHLGYIKNKASIKLLAEYVFSDAIVEGHGEHVLGFLPAHDAVLTLFKLIEYPKEIGDSDGFIELAQARAWLKTQKTLKIKE